MERTVEACGLDLIQLHGDESPAYCRLFPPERVIKAVSPRTPEELRALDVYEVRAFLVDARDAGRYGGTGKRADWELAARLGKTHPLILAGGLDAENIEAALAAVAPQAVDINSGCELGAGDQGSRPDAADHRDDSRDDRLRETIHGRSDSRETIHLGRGARSESHL